MKEYPLLVKIDSPADIKKFGLRSLQKLSEEVAQYIQEVVGNTGGHYSSPLGVVDLSIALHCIYDSPNDKLIWDVGHQAYAHKILTGRREQFKNIRQINGIGIDIGSSIDTWLNEYDSRGHLRKILEESQF